jgi:hypothetical protein
LYDYRTNVEQFPQWHEYLRKTSHRRCLCGALTIQSSLRKAGLRIAQGRAVQRGVKNAELHMRDTGHIAMEDHCDAVANLVCPFYEHEIAGRDAV